MKTSDICPSPAISGVPIDLAKYEVDPTRGVLSAHDPVMNLPAPFDVCDAIARELPKHC